MAFTIGSIDINDGSSDREFIILCDVDGAITQKFLRRYTVTEQGVTTSVDTELDGTTPYTPTGIVGECPDPEYFQQKDEFCAINDSPVDYPNPGDPIGTAYSVGDKITVQFVTEVNDLFNPILISVLNLSNGTFPGPLYLQLNGVDIIGSSPNFTDFGDCAQTIQVPQVPVIDGATFINGNEITGAITTHIFNVPLKGASVWNGGPDFILAEFTTVPVTTGGNRQMIIPPGGTAQVQIAVSTPELITQVELSTLNGGICPAIVNAVHPGGV